MVKKKRARKSKVPKPSRKSSRVKYRKKNTTWVVFVFLGVMVLFAVLFNVSQMNITGNVAMTGLVDAAQPQAGTWSQLLDSDPLADILTYVFGLPIILANLTSSVITSSIVVTIAIWLLMFFTFADIISTFSSFGMGKGRKWIPWVIALLITIVAANIGVLVKIVVVFTKIFSGIAIVGVYIGLGAALLAFIAVNLGIKGLSMWIMRRKAMMLAASSRSAGARLSGGITALSDITKKLEKFGEE